MKCKVLRPVNHDQKDYAPGTEIILAEPQADHLIGTGTVEPLPQVTPENNTVKAGSKERSEAAVLAASSPKARRKTTKSKEP